MALLKALKNPIFRFGAGVLLSVGLVFLFQNCAQTPQTGNEVQNSMYGGDPNLLNTAYPLTANFNQISYMSCPLAGKNPPQSDHVANPFYTFRYGAYDNSTMESFGSGLPLDRAKAGIGVTKGAMEYLLQRSTDPNPEFIADYITRSPYSTNKRLVASVLMRGGSRQKEQISKVQIAMPLLDVLSGTIVKGYLSSAAKMPDGSLEPMNFFSQSAQVRRSMSGSILFGNSELDSNLFRNDMNNDHMLFLGYTDEVNVGATAEPGLMMQNLLSPDGDVTKRLVGRGYHLSFKTTIDVAPVNSSGTWNGHRTLIGVNEFDTSPDKVTSEPVNLTQENGDNWTCFTATIVRDVDRKYYRNDQNVVIAKNAVDTFGGTKTESYFKDWAEVTTVETAMNASGVPSGIHFACPTMKEASLSISADMRDKLRIMRRFLPAEYWEINVEPGYMCAVPLAKATTANSCHVSGESANTKFINYRWNLHPDRTCGTTEGKNECPSNATFCYRRN